MSDARHEARAARLDEAIDGAVREMLDVEARGDLPQRVIERLSASGSRPSADGFRLPALVASGFSRNRVALAAASAALMLVAMFVARRSEPVAPPAPVVARAADVRLPSAVARSTPPVLTARGARRSAPARLSGQRGGVVAASVVADGDRVVADIEPLKTIAPIAIAPIVQDSIAPEEIALRPLDPISEVQVAPLTPPDRRN